MKCELCHEKDAAAAIVRVVEGVERELYVCRECESKEKLRRKQKSQRTRRVTMTNGEEPPPIIRAIADAFEGMISDIEKAGIEASAEITEIKPNPEPEEKLVELNLGKPPREYVLRGKLHLEGLYLLGELDAVKRGARALRLRLEGVEADGVRDTGRIYSLLHPEGAKETAARFVAEVIRQERNARVRLLEELPRVIGDALSRSLAILKNARLLSPGELFDLLSPIRLGLTEKLIDGIDFRTVERMAAKIDLTSSEDDSEPAERDRVDAERADDANARFEDVVLSERAEGLGI